MKKPFKAAVKGALSEFVGRTKSGSAVVSEWQKKVNTYYEYTEALIVKLANARADGVLPKLGDLPKLASEVKDELPETYQKGLRDIVNQTVKFFDTEQRLWHFVSTRADPILALQPNALQKEVTTLDSIVNSDKLDGLLDKAASLEEDELSWKATIGPAVTAIRRLGRRSAGKDAKSLAQYAKDHVKSPH